MIDTEKLLESVDLLDVIEADLGPRALGRWHCPWCQANGGSSLPLSVNGKLWHCFACNKAGNAIGWLIEYHGLKFTEACERLSAGRDYQTANPPAPKPKKTTLPPMPDSDFQTKMLAKVILAAECLKSAPAGQPGRDYLAGRGLHEGTRAIYSLGYSSAVNDPMLQKAGKPHIRQAIIIPWLDDDGLITCVNTRFIDTQPQPEGLRYKTQGKRSLFGLNAIWYAPALVVCEGELNCCSIHQANAAAGGLGLAVVSIGAQEPSELTLALLGALVKKFERVFCWVDEPKRSQAIVAALGKTAQALHSPDRDGVKLDANEMLQRGVLPDFLRAMLAA